MPATSSDVREHTEAILGLLDRLEAALGPERDVTAKVEDGTLARLAGGLATETNEAAAATKLLIRAGLVSDAWTSARRAFEHAVTAAWLVSGQSSVDAFATEKGARQSAALAKTIKRAGLPVSSEALAEADRELPQRTDEEKALGRFETICDAFHSKLYVVYRLASARVHPTLSSVALLYMEEDESNPPDMWQDFLMAANIAASSVVWAWRALDGLDRGQPMKRTLKAAARDLAISPALYPGMPDEGRWPI